MESISRIASELPLLSKGVVTGDKQLPTSVHAVEFNDDLLLEILLRLPVISLSRFRYVSKRWLSLIIGPHFTLRGIQNNNLYPPSAQILWRYKACFGYDFLPLDSRILSSGSHFQTISKFGSVTTKFKILQSCNGLLLCRSSSHDKLYYYVCNPSIHLFTMLPQPHIPHLTLDTFYGGVKLAFDPTKSPHYKVIHARPIYGDHIDDDDYIQIQTYFSGTRKWIILGGLFPCKDFECFRNGIYWNGAIHWLTCEYYTLPLHSKLDIVDHPVLTTTLLKLPLTSNRLVRFNVKLFESCGCLLLLYWDHTQPRQMNMYEMRNGHSEWSVKYLVNLNDILKLFPKTWSICPTVCCIALGEREEDSFMVMQLFGKLVQYKIVLKTVHTLCDLGSASLHERLTVMASLLVYDSTF